VIERKINYPAYLQKDLNILQQKVAMYLSYEQILEMANIFYYINKVAMSLPRFLGGIRPLESVRILHKSIHDAAINCCMSLEDKSRYEKAGSTNE